MNKTTALRSGVGFGRLGFSVSPVAVQPAAKCPTLIFYHLLQGHWAFYLLMLFVVLNLIDGLVFLGTVGVIMLILIGAAFLSVEVKWVGRFFYKIKQASTSVIKTGIYAAMALFILCLPVYIVTAIIHAIRWIFSIFK